jgi:hypothetical protein
LDEIDIKTRKRVTVYQGLDKKTNYLAIFFVHKSSRFLQKDVQSLEELYLSLVNLVGHNYKKKLLLYNMPLCSKAEELLYEYRWRLYVVD